MGFRHVTLTVKDMEASVRFYTEVVGLPIDKRYQAGPGVEITFLGDGETKVELICDPKQPAPVIGNGMFIGFSVGSVEEKYQSLKNSGTPILSEILQPNPQVKFFFVADPDGYQVQFIEM